MAPDDHEELRYACRGVKGLGVGSTGSVALEEPLTTSLVEPEAQVGIDE